MSSPDRVTCLRQRSVSRGLRMTPQRAVLLKVLGSLPHHPTAEEVYRRVRRSLPSVSAATVYRNLQQLARAGVVAPLAQPGTAVRYDANQDDHHHFVCTRCGRVGDIYLSGVAYTIRRRKSDLSGARVESCQVQLRGVCRRCCR